MKIETEKNKSICLLKVLTWNINKKLECKECIYWKGRCTHTLKTEMQENY